MKRILLALLLIGGLTGCSTAQRKDNVFDLSQTEYWPANYRITLYDEGKEVDHWLIRNSEVNMSPDMVTFQYRGRTVRLHGAVSVTEVGQ